MFFKSRDGRHARLAPAAGARTAIPSLLGSDLCITGDVSSSAEVQVDGRVEGDIIADSLIVSEAGVVEGAIAANTVRILGAVNGPITAPCVKLGRTARVTGDIVHQSLAVEAGAFVSGHCRRSEPEPPAEAASEAAGEADAPAEAPEPAGAF